MVVSLLLFRRLKFKLLNALLIQNLPSFAFSSPFPPSNSRKRFAVCIFAGEFTTNGAPFESNNRPPLTEVTESADEDDKETKNSLIRDLFFGEVFVEVFVEVFREVLSEEATQLIGLESLEQT